jgi:hypothetical protein
LNCERIRQLCDHFDNLIHYGDYNKNIIENTYGRISKLFSPYQEKNIKDFKWIKDEIFGNIFLNGPDPTQLRIFKVFFYFITFFNS